MLSLLCLSAVLDAAYLTPDGPKPRPAPIPARWLLKYAPKDLPPLPDTFAKTDWHYGFLPRSLRGAYDDWTQFRPDSVTTPGEVVLTHVARDFGNDERGVTVRRVPLAVYGPLVEYDGNLYTVAVSNWARDPKAKPVLMLNQGAAVEAPKNVWYQAGSARTIRGEVNVVEYRLEFADDPRANDGGKVKVFRAERVATEFDGKSAEADGEFKVNPDIKYLRDVVVTYPDGGRAVQKVHLQLGGDYAPVITGVSRSAAAVLTESGVPVPRPPKPAAPPGLMQPPKK